MRDDGGVTGRNRRSVIVAGTAVSGLGVAGLLMLSSAALGDGAVPYPVELGGTSMPVTPVTAMPSPGQALVFVNSGIVPYSLTRTATPFPLETTIAPGTSSTPFAVPVDPGSYPYTAQQQPLLPLANPVDPVDAVDAQVVVASPSAAETATNASSAAVATTVMAVSTSAPTRAGGKTTTRPKKSVPVPKRSRSKASASPSPSGSRTDVQVGGLLPAPAQPPSFSNGEVVPLPVLPKAGAGTPSNAAGKALGAPIAPQLTPSATLPVGPFAADAPRQGPRRSRGLPIALAFAVLLGVAGAIARTLVRTTRSSRRTR